VRVQLNGFRTHAATLCFKSALWDEPVSREGGVGGGRNIFRYTFLLYVDPTIPPPRFSVPFSLLNRFFFSFFKFGGKSIQPFS